MTQHQVNNTHIIIVNTDYTYMYNSQQKTLYLSQNYDLIKSYKSWVMQYGKDYNTKRGGLEKLLNNI